MMEFNEEDQDFLIILSQKINTQDKRSTSYVYFMVSDKVKEYGDQISGFGYDENERKDSDNLDINDLCDSCKKLYENDEDLPDDCEECDSDAYHWFKWERKIMEEDGVYFTAEACDEYIKRRRYAFNDPKSFGLSAYRSEEFKRVLEIISKITTNKDLLK